MSAPKISVLLISWNTLDETRVCLESLYETAAELDFEVVAVDNASRDGSAELLAADPRVCLIRNEHNVGFAAAVNQAHRAARGELVLLLNSDVVLHPNALPTMVAFLDEHRDAAGVSPLYLNPDGSFQQHYVQLPSFAACLAFWTVLKRAPGFRGALARFQMVGEDFSAPRELSSASCVLIRRTALGVDTIFDERLPVYWNDAILTRELHDAGQRMWMIPTAAVSHARGSSCRLLGPAMRMRHLLGGLVIYLGMTGPRARVELFRVVLTGDYLLKLLFGRTTTLGWTDLRAALRGDVGALPDGDIRDWVVMAGDVTIPHHAGQRVRRVIISADHTGGRHITVDEIDSSTWSATMPTMVPFGRRLAPVRWINRRLGAAQLRRWLDRHAGHAAVHVDGANAYLVGWLGEDVSATIEPSIKASAAPFTESSATGSVSTDG